MEELFVLFYWATKKKVSNSFDNNSIKFDITFDGFFLTKASSFPKSFRRQIDGIFEKGYDRRLNKVRTTTNLNVADDYLGKFLYIQVPCAAKLLNI